MQTEFDSLAKKDTQFLCIESPALRSAVNSVETESEVTEL